MTLAVLEVVCNLIYLECERVDHVLMEETAIMQLMVSLYIDVCALITKLYS